MGVVLSRASRKKVEVKLEQTGGTVFLWEYPLAGDLLGGMTIDSSGVSKNEISPLEAIKSLIAEWDFTDENGTILPITVENIGLLPVNDASIIATKVTEITNNSVLSKEVKKNT